jgi:hypothetical protein
VCNPNNGVKEIFTDNGAYQSWFNVRIKTPQGSSTTVQLNDEYPTFLWWVTPGTPTIGPTSGPYDQLQQALDVTQVLCNPDDPTSSSLVKVSGMNTPTGFSSQRKPVKVYCIAFGSLFDPSNTNATAVSSRATALDLLGKMQTVGSVSSAVSEVYGTSSVRQTNMANAIRSIMQDGYSITLIKDQ